MGTNKFRHGIYVTGSIKEVPFTPDPDSVSANPETHYYIKATSEGKTYYYCADGTWRDNFAEAKRFGKEEEANRFAQELRKQFTRDKIYSCSTSLK